ncbi:MAG: ATP-dependent ligase [Verrucomicrobiaceae bacterium]|nr:ATP-dependent ligase [Verrucomicrobiaceae bacterium]
MEASLDRYVQKRNFNATPEPKGRHAKKAKGALGFVIQKHAASHLHYDFRLELDGTLKSWAIPKGPSLDPKDKRLAVHVEDHPLDYADFEGTIPSGNYGAGTVIVWDRGEWIPVGDPSAGYDSGKLKFELRGTKLQGSWTLVKTHSRDGANKNGWLLIKERDDAARSIAELNIVEVMPDSVIGGESGKVWRSSRATKRSAAVKPQAKSPALKSVDAENPSSSTLKKSSKKSRSTKANYVARLDSMPKSAIAAPLPLTLAPQLAMLVDSVPRGGEWSYELKLDGYRLLARIDNGEVHLFTRNGNDWTNKLKHIAKALRAADIQSGWLDGEILMFDEKNQPSFQALQNAFENASTEAIQYFVFDVPYLNGIDLRASRLDERREILKNALNDISAPIVFSETLEMPAADLFKHACALQLEGLIGKRKSSPYQSARSRDWIKLKCLQRQEFVIGGYTDSKRPTADSFGALLLGVHESNGALRYVGRVGTGFSDSSLQNIFKKMKPLLRDEMPFDIFEGDKPTRAMHWIAPKLVAEVAFSAWTTGGLIRHSSFQGLRADKLAESVTAEKAVASSLAKTSLELSPSKNKTKKKQEKEIAEQDVFVKRTSSARKDSATSLAAKSSTSITHGDRAIDPKSGTTKQELVDFYLQIAPHLLPHLQDRPVSLVRAPAGIDGQLFFQKHLEGGRFAPAQKIKIEEIDVKFFPEHPPLITVNSESALAACLQMNTLEFHTWNTIVNDGEHPDRMIFDLDPGEGVSWKQIQDAAQLLKAMLDQLTLTSFLKTSGGKGLHVVVPLKPVLGWDVVKEFSAEIVRHLAKTLPMLFVAKSGPRNRVGRIFIDYLRNGRGATTATAFSVRARPGLGVSMPIAWDELTDVRGGDHWNIGNAVERAKKSHKKMWSGYAKAAQSLAGAMNILGFKPPIK